MGTLGVLQAHQKGDLMGVLALQEVVDANADDGHLHGEARGELPILDKTGTQTRRGT